MDIQPIRSDADHRRALRKLSAFFDHEPKPGTPDGDRFDVLLTLVEAHESRHSPSGFPIRSTRSRQRA